MLMLFIEKIQKQIAKSQLSNTQENTTRYKGTIYNTNDHNTLLARESLWPSSHKS